jgi:ATP-binding cassette subfamily C protein
MTSCSPEQSHWLLPHHAAAAPLTPEPTVTRLSSHSVPCEHAPHPAIAAALKDCRRAFWSVALFSAVVNMLMLAGPLYMLQVYDRVLASHSVSTLIALSALLCGAFAFQAFMDLIRNRVVTRSAGFLDEHLSAVVLTATIRLSAASRQVGEMHEPVRDLDQVRTFLTGQGPIAIVDLPWIPVFLLICGLIHPWLGMLSLVGGIMLASATLLTERASRTPGRELNRSSRARSIMVEANRRNSETTAAMGLETALSQRWLALNAGYLAAVERSSDVISFYANLSKVTRIMLQSAALGLGAYLVIRQELMPGAMIAASIIMARALAPIETAIANWRGFVAARDSIRRLTHVLARVGTNPVRTALPKPRRSLDAENVAVVPPEGKAAIVGNVSFTLTAGEVMGIIGPSGSGKTSLVRALVGIWQPAQGAVRVDGAALEQWPPEIIGPELGYLSQAVDLFDGTVAENIGRMAVEPDDAAVVRAAQAAGAHEMILQLQDGYDTRIGPAGAILSAGQRQRLALARALYGDPFLIVLDEPNANLDGDGEAALLHAIRDAKGRGAIIILIAHRAGMLSVCDKVLVLRDGAQHAFGPRHEILRHMAPQPAIASTNANLKIVGAGASGEVR